MKNLDQPIDYIRRTRNYYQALGYKEPYNWAHNTHIPFSNLQKTLSESCVAVVTTAAPYQEEKGDQGPGAPYNAGAKFFEAYAMPSEQLPDLRISHIAIDRDHTSAEDIGTYFPLAALKKAMLDKKIDRIAKRFYGLPTNRSKRITVETDSQQLLTMCKADDVDIALLVPNCPVCHQSVSLAARTLEAQGIITVVMGCAKDIVERVGVPRFLFSDFPLGNSAGRPNDKACQEATLSMALDLAVDASLPGTTIQSTYRWSTNSEWKEDYANPDKLSDKEIALRRNAFNEAKTIAKKKLHALR